MLLLRPTVPSYLMPKPYHFSARYLGTGGGGVIFDPIKVSASNGLGLSGADAEFNEQQNDYFLNGLSDTCDQAQLDADYNNEFQSWPNPMLDFSGPTLSEPRLTADAVVAYAIAYRNTQNSSWKSLYESLAKRGAEFLLCVQSFNANTSNAGLIIDDLDTWAVNDNYATGTDRDVVTEGRCVEAFWQCYESFGDPKYETAALLTANYILSNPVYPYTLPSANYSDMNYLAEQVEAYALTYEFTGQQVWLDNSMRGAEEIMAWQDFQDQRQNQGDYDSYDTKGGWYYYDWNPEPAPPSGSPTDQTNSSTEWGPDKKMNYHTVIMRSLLEVLKATGYQWLPWETTGRDDVSFFGFKCNLINSIVRGLNFMIDNQEDGTIQGEVKGGFFTYNKGMEWGNTSGTPAGTQDLLVYNDDCLGILVKAYRYLSMYSTVSNSNLTTLLSLIDGYVQCMATLPNQWPSDPEEWYLIGNRGWSQYLSFLNNPVSRTLTLVNPSFEDKHIQWEFWVGQGGSVNQVSGESESGLNSLEITDNSTSTGDWAAQLNTATPNTGYTVSAYAYVNSGDHQTLYVKFLNQNFQELGENSTVVYPNVGFQNVTVSAVSPAGTAYIVPLMYSAAAYTSNGYWDNVSIAQQAGNNKRSGYSPAASIHLGIYPNPSNPAPVIQFTLNQTSRVEVQVYDILGRCVATLLDSQQSPGTHLVHFGTLNLASGVYFCRVLANHMSQVQKFLILK